MGGPCRWLWEYQGEHSSDPSGEKPATTRLVRGWPLTCWVCTQGPTLCWRVTTSSPHPTQCSARGKAPAWWPVTGWCCRVGGQHRALTESRCTEGRVVLEGDPVARDLAHGWLGRVLCTVAVLPDDPGELLRSPPFSPDPASSVVVTGWALGPEAVGQDLVHAHVAVERGVTRPGGLSPHIQCPRAPWELLSGTCSHNQELPRPPVLCFLPCGLTPRRAPTCRALREPLHSDVLFPPELCFSSQMPVVLADATAVRTALIGCPGPWTEWTSLSAEWVWAVDRHCGDPASPPSPRGCWLLPSGGSFFKAEALFS